MRSVLALIILTISLSFILTGCPANLGAGQPPPKYSAVDPRVFPDGAGNFLTVYQVATDSRKATYLQKLDQQGNLLWDKNGIELFPWALGYISSVGLINGDGQNYYHDGGRVTLVGDAETSPVYIQNLGDGEFNVFAVLTDGIWMQRIDSDGHFLWPPSTLPDPLPASAYSPTVVSHTYINPSIRPIRSNITFKQISNNCGSQAQFIEDKNGNFIIGFSNVVIQKFDQDGELLWSRSDLFNSSIYNYSSQIVIDLEGNILVALADPHLSIQKLNGASGESMWPLPVELPNLNPDPNYDIEIITDGQGGCLVDRLKTEQISHIPSPSPSSMFTWTLVYTRIDAEGQTVWQKDIATYHNLGGPTTKLMSDGAGGAFLYVNDRQSAQFQHISTDGAIDRDRSLKLGNFGMDVDNTTGELTFDLTAVHQMEAAGFDFWGSAVRPMGNGMIQDGEGGFIIPVSLSTGGSRFTSSYSSNLLRFDSEGKMVWNKEPNIKNINGWDWAGSDGSSGADITGIRLDK